jgi:hypothetical protein
MDPEDEQDLAGQRGFNKEHSRQKEWLRPKGKE